MRCLCSCRRRFVEQAASGDGVAGVEVGERGVWVGVHEEAEA